jgi:hypothetical protein
MTYSPRSDFLNVMRTRGFLADCTDMQGLDETLLKGSHSAYIGFDATAKSLHVGSLIQIMMLRWFQKTGHKPITLMGGARPRLAIRPFGPMNARFWIAPRSMRTSQGSNRCLPPTSTMMRAHRC